MKQTKKVIKILQAESHVSPEDWKEVDLLCSSCSEPLSDEDHVKCADCAEAYVLDLARENSSFACEIISGEYAPDYELYQQDMLMAWEIGDPQLMFDTFADSMIGIIQKEQEAK